MQSGRCCCPGGSTPQQFYRRRGFEVVQFCMGELRSIRSQSVNFMFFEVNLVSENCQVFHSINDHASPAGTLENVAVTRSTYHKMTLEDQTAASDRR